MIKTLKLKNTIFEYKLGKNDESNKPTIKISERFLICVLLLFSVISWFFYSRLGLTLAYNDARSHLNVARRVFDNLQPGFAQIGSVWLPLYHILELPFIWNDYLWKSGLAGSIVSMLSYILGGVYLFRLTKEIKFDYRAQIVSLLSYALNPNILFMQATPMTESLLIFLAIACVYYLVRWAKRLNFIDLVLGAFFVFLSTLTRYDGWFLLLFVTIATFIVAYRKKGISFAKGNMLLLLTLAAFGVTLWFLWNLMIFGDPFYFAFGPFSAKSQQNVLLSEGRLVTKGNLVYSTFIYFLTCLFNYGYVLTFLSIFGGILFILSKSVSKNMKIMILMFLVPYVFNVVSLYFGHSVIHLPGIFPYTWFNDRYGLMLLPAVSIFVGYLSKNKKCVFYILTSVVILQFLNMYITNNIITIQDGVRGASGEYLDEAGSWISENVDDGLILVAASSNDSLLFTSGLSLNRFITEGVREYWDNSLEDPTKYAKWIIMHKGDLVEVNLRENEKFLNNYSLVYKDDFSYVYKLNTVSSDRLTEDQLPI